MIRISMLRNCPVFCGERQVGLLHKVCISPKTNAVGSLVVAGGFAGKRLVSAAQILSITRSAIQISGSLKYCKELDLENPRFVCDSNELLLGKITDCMLCAETNAISAFQMVAGFLTALERKRIWLYSWEYSTDLTDSIIVTQAQSSELKKLAKGEKDEDFDDERNGRWRHAGHDLGRRTDDDAKRETDEKGFEQGRC